VAFNNHPGSTKSYDYVREHNDAVNRLDVIEGRGEIAVDYGAGELVEVEQHDGTVLRLRKLDPDYDPVDRLAAMTYVNRHQALGEVVTGLLYVDPAAQDLHGHLGTPASALNALGAPDLCPGPAVLDRINASLR
jgi:2-oxoglutarate ferredoxin oxidoreductase subunit beta